MARIVVKKVKQKRRSHSIHLLHLAIVVFGCSAFLFLCSSLFLRTYNNSLSARVQEIKQEIATIETQNDSLEVEISKLVSVDRIDEIAANGGLSRNQNNIVRIDNQTSGEGD